MRVLIVDDETPARERLRRLLLAFDDIDVVGQARDGDEALAAVATLAPDALFLDVQMPGANGIDVAASLPEPPPAIVFVTAHGHYAVQAFDAAAVDYLLKPVEPQRLGQALQRLRDRLGAARPPLQPAQLLVADRSRTHVVAVADILWLEAADNYVILHTPERSPLLRRTLSGLLDDLGAGFVRTHRGAAVALAHVVQLEPLGKGDARITLHGGQAAPCSRQYRDALVSRLAAPR